MSSSVLYQQEFSWMKEGVFNEITWWILQHFFNEKFFPIFSFLFGVGFGMQIQKMEEKGIFSSAFFLRRYLILLLFGLIHLIFIWPGDVLALYAAAGMILLVLRKVPLKYMIVLSIIILLFPFYAHIRNFINQVFIDAGLKPIISLYDYNYHDIVDLKIKGTLIEKIRFRLHEYSIYYRNVEYFPLLLCMIFLGYTAGKLKFYARVKELLSALKYFAIAGILFVIAVHFIYFSIADPGNYPLQIILKKTLMISNIIQAFLYLYIIGLLYENRLLVKFLKPLTYAGRMSLTNYIMQSIVAVFVFRGFIQLYGRLELTELEILALLVFSLLLIGSWLWLKKFRYGPLEWLWREISYAKPITFRKIKD